MYSVGTVGTNYRIGVDGGGTKTELILVDSAGVVVARHLAPGCNPSQVGPEKTRAILQEALRELTAKKPDVITTSLWCMAGSRDFWRETADALTGYGRITTTDDAQPVLELATGGRPGLVLHAGTGSFALIRAPDGSVHFVGGLGWKLGDPGSGFDLGRRGIALALLGLKAGLPGPPSPLAAALCAHTGLADYAANSHLFYNDPAANATIAAFAPRVLELATQDDAPARQALVDSIADLVRQTDPVVRQLFPGSKTGNLNPGIPLGISGRILNSAPAVPVLRARVAEFQWPVELRPIDAAPIEGVRQLLLKIH